MTRSQWFILTSAILWLGFMAGVAAYEQSVFDWHFAREEAQGADVVREGQPSHANPGDS